MTVVVNARSFAASGRRERLLVCGSRDARDPKPTYRALERRREKIACIIVGGAPGVDTHAERWGKRNGIPVLRIDAQWRFYGGSAGPIRNGWMLELARPTRVLALPGNKGTRDMVQQALAAGVLLTTVGWKRKKA